MNPGERDIIRAEQKEIQDYINAKIKYLEERFDCRAIIHELEDRPSVYMVTLADRAALREIRLRAKQEQNHPPA